MSRFRFAPLAMLAILFAPSVAMAAGDNHGFIFEQHGFYIIDFVIFVGLLWYFVRGPARKFLEKRHQAVKEEMEEATRIKGEAEERLARYEKLLSGLEGEVAKMRDEFKADGRRERERIMNDALKAAQKIKKDAEVRLSQEINQVRADLESEVAKRALEIAEEKIKQRVGAEQQRELVKDYVGDIEKLQDLDAAHA